MLLSLPTQDKTKYEEERESLLAQLKLHEDSPSDSLTNSTSRSPDKARLLQENHYHRLNNDLTDTLSHRRGSDGNDFPTYTTTAQALEESVFLSRPAELRKASSPVYSSPANDSPDFTTADRNRSPATDQKSPYVSSFARFEFSYGR